jgi:large subunit ribosomal protein L17e
MLINLLTLFPTLKITNQTVCFQGRIIHMTHYSRKPQVSSKAAKAKVSDLRCHFKNTFETANVINGMPLRKAQQLYRQVLAKTRCIPFRRYNGKTGRTAQAKEWGHTKGRWPRKSVVAMMSLLKNAEANAIEKGLNPNQMIIKHVQVDQAARMRRRTFRAHGRITPYMCSPCHVQLFMSEKKERVPAPKSAPKK